MSQLSSRLHFISVPETPSSSRWLCCHEISRDEPHFGNARRALLRGDSSSFFPGAGENGLCFFLRPDGAAASPVLGRSESTSGSPLFYCSALETGETRRRSRVCVLTDARRRRCWKGAVAAQASSLRHRLPPPARFSASERAAVLLLARATDDDYPARPLSTRRAAV